LPNFQWSINYFFIEINGKAVCLVYRVTVSVFKEFNIKRHYESKNVLTFLKIFFYFRKFVTGHIEYLCGPHVARGPRVGHYWCRTRNLKVTNQTQLYVLANWVLGKLEDESNFSKKIVFSDEAHFWMNGYVNKQNCRIWDDTNPHEIHQNKMLPQTAIVWCRF
jgi:hypothetical protein